MYPLHEAVAIIVTMQTDGCVRWDRTAAGCNCYVSAQLWRNGSVLFVYLLAGLCKKHKLCLDEFDLKHKEKYITVNVC